MTKDLTNEMMQTLNELEGVFIVDLYKQSLALPANIKQVLIDDIPGYYIPGVNKPFVSNQDKDRITVVNKTTNESLNTSIDELLRIADINKSYFKNIHIQLGNNIITGYFFLQQCKSFTNTPTASYVQMQFIKDLLLDVLYQRCRQNTHSFGKYYKYIKPEGRDLIDTYNCGDDLREVIDSLNSFISRHVNNLYFHKELGTNLIIEKSVDYRVYEYYKLLQKVNPPEYL